jgi:hypothetical protein
MPDHEVQLRALGNIHLDANGTGDAWLEVEPDRFRYVVFALSGPCATGDVFKRSDVETICGRLVPLPD